MLVHYNQQIKTVENVCVTYDSEIPFILDFEKNFFPSAESLCTH